VIWAAAARRAVRLSPAQIGAACWIHAHLTNRIAAGSVRILQKQALSPAAPGNEREDKMNEIPGKDDWKIELRYMLILCAIMFAIIGGLFVLSAKLHVWVL